MTPQETIDMNVKICEMYAIEFALWIRDSGNLIILHKQSLPITRLLEEFKKKKAL